MRVIAIAFLPLLLAFAPASTGPAPQVPSSQSREQGAADPGVSRAVPAGDEFAGPFPSWVNVKAAHGAVGDGVADDTNALQAGLDGIVDGNRAPVLFVPAGTYRITRTLVLNLPLSIALVGEDPDRTRIVWDGAEGGTMLAARGMAYSRIDRLTFDGRTRASVGVEQAWDGEHGNFDTGNQYADDRFIDLEFGIRGGFEGHGFAETSVTRARFIRNSKAGIALGNFNALDLWVWHSLFEDCGVGVTNDPGAGNYRVYDSVFRRSRVADLQMQNTGGFTARGNFSIGSKAFWVSGAALNHPATIDVQRNTIIDPQSAVVIRMGNQGPALVMDNRIRSLPNTGGPILTWSSLFGADVMSIGNTFTVSNAVSANGRLLTLDDRIVTREGISADEPQLPAAEQSRSRRVFEVAAGSAAVDIQRVIDTAVRSGSARAIVHFPFGRYAIDRTLVVPASDVQMVGDGTRSVLRWTGAGDGPMVTLQSPTHVAIRELQLEPGSGNGIVAAGVDQPGARIHLEGVQLRSGRESNLTIDRAGRASVQMVDIGHAYGPSGTSIRVIGDSGNPPADAGRTAIYSGASASNRLSYDVSGAATLVARDIWYEGRADGGFLRVRDQGRALFQGVRVASPKDHDPPAFVVETTASRFSLLTTLLDDRLVVDGAAGRSEVLGLSNLREDSALPLFTNSSGAPAAALFRTGRQRARAGGLIQRGTIALADIGPMNAVLIRRGLRDTRELPEPSLAPVASAVTDLRLFRVAINGGANNLIIAGASR